MASTLAENSGHLPRPPDQARTLIDSWDGRRRKVAGRAARSLRRLKGRLFQLNCNNGPPYIPGTNNYAPDDRRKSHGNLSRHIKIQGYCLFTSAPWVPARIALDAKRPAIGDKRSHRRCRAVRRTATSAETHGEGERQAVERQQPKRPPALAPPRPAANEASPPRTRVTPMKTCGSPITKSVQWPPPSR